ncbi:hypothetical protein Bca4012_089179 [Brassica carinata]
MFSVDILENFNKFNEAVGLHVNLDDQINCFKKTKEVIRAQIGDRAANNHVNDAIYFIGLGSNDYVNNFLQPFMADGQQYTHDEFVELLTSTLDNQLTLPFCIFPNSMVMEFNTRTKKLLEYLNKRLPGAKFAFADTYPAVLVLIDNPTRYGFKVANTSCCNVDTSVGGLCLPNSNMCKNRKDFVFLGRVPSVRFS